MVAAFTRGFTYAAGATVTSTNVSTLLVGATVNNVDRTNVDSTDAYGITAQDTEPPNLGTLEPWLDTDVYWPLTKISGGDWASLLPQAALVGIDAGSADILKGEGLGAAGMTGSMPVLTKAVSTAKYNVVAVAAQNITAGQKGVAIYHGLCKFKMDSAPVAGNPLKLSDTDGRFEPGSVGASSGPLTVGICFAGQSGDLAWGLLQK